MIFSNAENIIIYIARILMRLVLQRRKPHYMNALLKGDRTFDKFNYILALYACENFLTIVYLCMEWRCLIIYHMEMMIFY